MLIILIYIHPSYLGSMSIRVDIVCIVPLFQRYSPLAFPVCVRSLNAFIYIDIIVIIYLILALKLATQAIVIDHFCLFVYFLSRQRCNPSKLKSCLHCTLSTLIIKNCEFQKKRNSWFASRNEAFEARERTELTAVNNYPGTLIITGFYHCHGAGSVLANGWNKTSRMVLLLYGYYM